MRKVNPQNLSPRVSNPFIIILPSLPPQPTPQIQVPPSRQPIKSLNHCQHRARVKFELNNDMKCDEEEGHVLATCCISHVLSDASEDCRGRKAVSKQMTKTERG